ncbi:multicopper oxidase domain-containing protein [Tropicibacter naphthalenivorans]|uniref:Copper resistance protein A n=1 Tax=Tropicibacter naphthalenivorans TaxID=441103 RepID=A0A0P1GFX3_9RHOB|nr:multicopper oxidase domain-containing protein [Tropicibacter naphthalenivorans]CUH80640.1 Copper resistance protein A precursor [Tropicibacter naphthalenivorans]SMC89152.1 Multicopper oxidase [Tropicibacter naphthalenivorans]
MAAGLAAPSWAAPAVTLRPEAREVPVAGRRLPMLAFNGSVPGPELRFGQGDVARITLDNGLDDGALVHWHGLRVPNRMDVIADVTGPVVIRDTYGGADDLLGALAAEGARPVSTAPIPRLPANPVAQPGTASQTASLALQGGAGGAPHKGTGIWALNDISGLPRQPLLRARRGETVRIEMVNQTGFPHGMHLHGHHFQEVDASGGLGPLRDTLLLNAGDTRSVLVVFDNPGRWMLHCHMLSHQADGMATWCEVI